MLGQSHVRAVIGLTTLAVPWMGCAAPGGGAEATTATGALEETSEAPASEAGSANPGESEGESESQASASSATSDETQGPSETSTAQASGTETTGSSAANSEAGDEIDSSVSTSSTETSGASSVGDTGESSNAATSDAGSSTTADGEPGRDAFGIEQLYPSAAGGGVWTAEHWLAAGPYTIDDREDPNDPLGISGMRGTGTLEVTEEGELVMGGSQPRIYVYPGPQGPWQNVEVTVYYRRVADDGTAYAGLVVGVRSGPEGHGDTPCDAHTYYGRLRHDGSADFAKELMHPESAAQSSVDADTVWPGDGELPFETWIGWKFVIYNLPDDAGVKLETYRDLSAGQDGGTWELVNETIDDTGWNAVTTCTEHGPTDGESDMAVTEGGTTFIRNTNIEEAHYRWFSIREISP